MLDEPHHSSEIILCATSARTESDPRMSTIAAAIDPPDAILCRMEAGQYTRADLDRLPGWRQRASNVLMRKRPLTMKMAWRLHRER